MGGLFGGGGAPLPPVQQEPAITNAEAQANSKEDSIIRAEARLKRRGAALTRNRVSLVNKILDVDATLS